SALLATAKQPSTQSVAALVSRSSGDVSARIKPPVPATIVPEIPLRSFRLTGPFGVNGQISDQSCACYLTKIKVMLCSVKFSEMLRTYRNLT
ncbi:MAG: hypothetical protein ACO4CP_12525, partial [Steroidobacteraceae bacterium]